MLDKFRREAIDARRERSFGEALQAQPYLFKNMRWLIALLVCFLLAVLLNSSHSSVSINPTRILLTNPQNNSVRIEAQAAVGARLKTGSLFLSWRTLGEQRERVSCLFVTSHIEPPSESGKALGVLVIDLNTSMTARQFDSIARATQVSLEIANAPESMGQWLLSRLLRRHSAPTLARSQ